MPYIVDINEGALQSTLLILEPKTHKDFNKQVKLFKTKFGSFYYNFNNQRYFVIYRIAGKRIIAYWFLDSVFSKKGLATRFFIDFYFDFLTGLNTK